MRAPAATRARAMATIVEMGEPVVGSEDSPAFAAPSTVEVVVGVLMVEVVVGVGVLVVVVAETSTASLGSAQPPVTLVLLTSPAYEAIHR